MLYEVGIDYFPMSTRR